MLINTAKIKQILQSRVLEVSELVSSSYKLVLF